MVIRSAYNRLSTYNRKPRVNRVNKSVKTRPLFQRSYNLPESQCDGDIKESGGLARKHKEVEK